MAVRLGGRDADDIRSSTQKHIRIRPHSPRFSAISSQLERNTCLFQPSLSTPHVGLRCRPSSCLVRIAQAVRSGVFRSLNSCHSDCVAGATAGWSRRSDYEQPAGELAWHELGDLVQALRPVLGEWERQLLSSPMPVWLHSPQLDAPPEAVTKLRDVWGVESQLRQEFPKLVQDPKARLGFAGDDGLVAADSDARLAWFA